MVNEAELVKINLACGTVRLPNCRDLNVPLRDLAPVFATSLLYDLPEHKVDHLEMAMQNNLNTNGEQL